MFTKSNDVLFLIKADCGNHFSEVFVIERSCNDANTYFVFDYSRYDLFWFTTESEAMVVIRGLSIPDTLLRKQDSSALTSDIHILVGVFLCLQADLRSHSSCPLRCNFL